jgi:hypothetical protein
MNYSEKKNHFLSILTTEEKSRITPVIKMLEKSYDTGVMDYVLNSYEGLSEDLQDLFDILACKLFPSWN